MPDKKSTSGRNYSKYDDWICIFCQNHNYSFRTVCTSPPHPGNRCHSQTKEYNTYLLLLQQGLIEPPQLPASPEPEPCSSEEAFPNFVLLMVSEEPW